MVLLVFSVVILDIEKVLGCYHMLLYTLSIDFGLLIPCQLCHVSALFFGGWNLIVETEIYFSFVWICPL